MDLKKIKKCFSEDITASSTSILLCINRNTINNKFRELLLDYSLRITGKEFGEFELNESYFVAKLIRCKRSRGAAGKMPVFGLLKREGKVYVTMFLTVPKKN